MDDLLKEIRDYCQAADIELSTFCTRAVNDGKFAARLERGGECLPRTAARVRDFIRNNPPQRRTSQPEAAA